MASESGGFRLRHVGNVVAALPLLVALGGPAAAAGGATAAVSVRVDLRYNASTSTWRGSFRAVRPDGAVVVHGRVVDRPRQRFGAGWLIGRMLTTRSGVLRFRITGPFTTPDAAQLRWRILGGTGAYAGLHGHGVDIERMRATTATSMMRGVPLPMTH
jgi:hypothetical protein